VSSPQVEHAPARTRLPDVTSVYQPIVALHTGETVGYEALVRGPAGSDLHSPAELFAFARRHGEEARLDFAARAAAFRGALASGLPASIPLFVNAEPRWLAAPWPPALEAFARHAHERLQVVVEVTERALVHDPAGLLRAVDRLRAAGVGVALDDVGADPASLALMPFLEPDVIKLDLRLVQKYHADDVAAIAAAVEAQAERSGAAILAEGIETEAHRVTAMALGATLGQGWLLGRPAALPAQHVVPRHEYAFTRPARDVARTPFQSVRGARAVRRVTKELLLPASRHLERQALRIADAPVVLAAFEDAAHFTPATTRRYRDLAGHCVFVGALGVDMPASPVPDVLALRGAELRPDDPLAGEWVVCVVGAHFAGALIAADLGDDGPDRQRRFDAVITHDRDLVIDAARSLLARIVPVPEPAEHSAG
jgi:EAL domain-containing protein (putative c-di-GMP-specific phosphodiesterase class I)